MIEFSDDARLRIRVWIEAELVDEQWIDVSNEDFAAIAARMQAKHMKLVEAANDADRPWLVEFFDPGRPIERAYYRFGTDDAGMIEPAEYREARP